MGVMTLDVMTHPQAEHADREAQRVHAHREELVERLRQDFDQPLRIEQLARELGMSICLGVAPPLQGRHGAEPAAIPEAAAAPGGPPSAAGRRPRRGTGCLPRGVPRRLPLQSGVQDPLTTCGPATVAGRRS